MAEWFKAARQNGIPDDHGTWVRRPEGEAEGAERLSTSYSFVADENESARMKFCEKIDYN